MTDNKQNSNAYLDLGSLIDFSYFDRMSDDDFKVWYLDWIKNGARVSYYWGKDIVISKIMPPTEKKEK